MRRGPKPELWESRMAQARERILDSARGREDSSEESTGVPRTWEDTGRKEGPLIPEGTFLSLWPETLAQLHSAFSLLFVGSH